jgi:hypothetical protein
MRNLTRRNFIKTTAIASASLSPVAAALAEYFGIGVSEIEDALAGKAEDDPEFHLIDNNLINIHFYFLNVKKKRRELTPKSDGKSFMIVRLPQQHVSEAGFWKENWTSEKNNKPFAMLSGFSFLAFQMWPTVATATKRRLQFTLDTILDWNNESNFQLITLIDWLDLKQAGNAFTFADLAHNCPDFTKRKIWLKPAHAEGGVLARYQSIVSQLFEGNASATVSSFVPVTFFEVPHEVCLVPLLRKKTARGEANPGKARFWTNQIPAHPSKKPSARKYEIWSNTLFYERPQPGDVAADQPKNQEFVFETPSFRIAGLISDQEPPCPNAPTEIPGCANNPCSYPDDPSGQPDKRQDILPTLLDKAELAYLTQFATDENRDNADFDIKELNGFFFTGLGVITHLKYDTQRNLPPGIDLIEYEHKITQGRDVFVKVARLGYNSKTGQKYKHVIEGKRKIQTEPPKLKTDPPLASFIELKQYCECIEPEIAYTEFDGDVWKNQQFVPCSRSTDPINLPVTSNTCHYRRGPFRALRITDKKRVPIDCLQDTVIEPKVCPLEQLQWFWVINEGNYQDTSRAPIKDSDVPFERYVLCHYQATDWEGATHEAATPFMFIRKCFVEEIAANPKAADAAYDNYLKGKYDKQAPRDPLVERRLTHFSGEKLAFTITPKPPNPTLFRSGETVPTYDSKTNILESDYFESYFNIKNTNWTSDPDAGKTSFGEKRYVVFPQVLRARVFLDHIRDIAQTKIASVVEFHPDYIDGGFDEYLPGTKLKNYGKLILQHTKAYVDGVEEPINQTHGNIKTALQQAKDKLGNLAVPDIIPDAISLDQSGITLPPNLTDAITKGRATFDDVQNKLKALNPRELLRGKVSEILGGIDLVAILDELIPQDDSPLFELKKLANELEKVEQAVLNSDVYKEIFAELATLKSQIDTAVSRVNETLAKIKNAQLAVNTALRNISNLVPNVDELDAIVKKLFERYRTAAFELLLDNVKFKDVEQLINQARNRVNDFLAQELPILKLEFQAKLNELKKFFDEVTPDFGNLPSELKLIGGKDPRTYFSDEITHLYDLVVNGTKPFNDYQQKVDNLFKTVSDNAAVKVSSEPVYYKVRSPKSTLKFNGYTAPIKDVIEWELTTKDTSGAEQLFDLSSETSGYVQLQKKVEDFRTLVAGNLESANAFQKAAVAEIASSLKTHEQSLAAIRSEAESFQSGLELISRNIREWNDTAEKVRQLVNDPRITPEVKESVKRVQELILKGNSYVDFLRKADPYFYYIEQERLKKDVLDVKRRFFGALVAKWGPIQTFEPCPKPPACPTPGPFTTVTQSVRECVCAYECVRDKLLAYATNPANSTQLNDYIDEFNKKVKTPLDSIKGSVLQVIQENLNDYPELKKAYQSLKDAKTTLTSLQDEYKGIYQSYLDLVSSQAKEARKTITDRVQDYINKREQELATQVDPNVVRDLQSKINEARNVYRALTSIKQQDLTYKWSTSRFHDVNLGILTFKKGSDPDTKLTVDVRITTHFSPGKFPPAIERIETLAENRLTNFGVGFFNVLTLGFSEVSFRAASGQSPHFAVKIKDVKFDGSFSFVQEFEKWMAGKGLILTIEADRLVLGYSLPLPSIQTPSFAFFNLSLNFDIRLYFDNRPMRFGFSFARPDLKFGIAAGIYAGFGFFGLVGEPKRGIVEMDAALEAGAWIGISIGPISGEVKLAFGFRYTRNDAGVRLEGYIVAEGRLSVWIIEVSARIYLGVVSENSYVEGQCTVTYSAKLGFVSKSFSGTFHQKIAGAQSKNQDENAGKLLAYHQTLGAFNVFAGLPPITILSSDLYSGCLAFLNTAQNKTEPETKPVSRKSWKRFARIM